MLLGSLRGNVLLGIGLHYTRLFVCLAVFPRLPADDATIYAVLLAWSLTEVARYPFYIAPSPATSALRGGYAFDSCPRGSNNASRGAGAPNNRKLVSPARPTRKLLSPVRRGSGRGGRKN